MVSRRQFLRLTGFAGASCCTGCNVTGNGAGWTKAEIRNIETTAGSFGGSGWAAWQNGRQLAAWREEERGPSLSITKTIAALAATAAMGKGMLEPSDKVADTLHEWRNDPRKARITISMLLQQTSGLEAGVVALYRSNPADKGKAAVALRAVDEPGTVFRYGPSHWEVLAELLRRKLAANKQTSASFIARSVLLPIGISSPKWRSDKQDIAYLSTGAEFSVNDLGRLGRTLARLLNGSNAAGFNAENFAAVTRPSSINPMFGGGLWRNSNADRASRAAIEVENALNHPLPSSFWRDACLSLRQPVDFTALIGSGGRRVYLWPGEGKVIARLGSSNSWNDIRFLTNV